MKKIVLLFMVMLITLTSACMSDSSSDVDSEEPIRYVFSGSGDVDEEIINQVQRLAAGYQPGIITQEGWESSWLQMRYVVPEGAINLTREELDNYIKELYSGYNLTNDQMEKIMSENTYEMYVKTPREDFVLSVYVEFTDPTTTVDSYINVHERQIEKVTDMDFEIISREETEKLAGKEFRHAVFEGKYEDIILYEELWLRKIDNRMIQISASYFNEDERERFMNGFLAY